MIVLLYEIRAKYTFVLIIKYSQCRIFELFISVLDVIIQNARTEGNLDSGIVDIKANIIELEGKPKVIQFLLCLQLLKFFLC